MKKHLDGNQIADNFNIWMKIEPKIRKFCNWKWKTLGVELREDICSAAMELFATRNTKQSEPETVYYAILKARQAARRLIGKKISFVNIDALESSAMEPRYFETYDDRIRLKTILAHPLLGENQRKVMNGVLAGKTFAEVGGELGMAPGTLTHIMHDVGKRLNGPQLVLPLVEER